MNPGEAVESCQDVMMTADKGRLSKLGRLLLVAQLLRRPASATG